MTDQARLVPDMLESVTEVAVRHALERFFASEAIVEIWPTVVSGEHNSRIPLGQVEIVVLPLDRIGAPAGASGANVYVAYYAHCDDGASRHAPSSPLVVKIGTPDKLRKEKQGADGWPKLSKQHGKKFAFPLDLYESGAERAVLLAPFQSLFKIEKDGSRNRIEVVDLWRLLDDKMELSPAAATDWGRIARLVAQAIDAMQHTHRSGRAVVVPTTMVYAEQYARYLRKTTAGARHVPDILFGTERTTNSFGRDWPNPSDVVHRIIDSQMTFSGRVGAVHGDLHPKNIVLDDYDAVQIIDFGWAEPERHVVIDFVLLDLNLRGTTLPSQVSQAGVLDFAAFLDLGADLSDLPDPVRERARIIRDVIWEKARERAVVSDWTSEYLIPLFLVGYGLLVHLDSARNQPSLVATVLQLAMLLDDVVPGAATGVSA